MDIHRRSNESIKQYKIRLFKNRDLYELRSQDIANLINRETGNSFSESAYRKWFKVYDEGYQDAKKEILSGSKLLQEYEIRRVEFEKEKIKFFDQRTAYNKIVRQQARHDELRDIITRAIDNLPQLEYKNNFPETVSDNDLIIGLNDIHYGIEIDNYWNKYNSDICRDRLLLYFSKILSIQETHNSRDCYVCANGDLISGRCHVPIALANRENVIEQIIGVSEVLSIFLRMLSDVFNKVYFSVVSGNHSRLDTKSNSLKDERLDLLIPWYIKARLQNQENIVVMENNLDATMFLFNVRGKNYLSVHGDYDDGKNMAVIVSSMLKKNVYAVLTGHKHHNAMGNQQGIKVIMSGSLLGVDDYCVQKRIYGYPEQVVIVATCDGIDAIYDILLEKGGKL